MAEERAVLMNLRRSSAGQGTSAAGKVKALVVEDSLIMLNALVEYLEHQKGILVAGTATDGRQGVELARALSPDLILMDFRLPRLNGGEATLQIKQLENAPVIIMLSSDDSPIVQSVAKTAGADAFVAKSGDMYSQLTAKLEELFPQV